MTSTTVKTLSLALLLGTSVLTPAFAQTSIPAPAAAMTTAAKPDADMAEVLSVLAGLGGKPIEDARAERGAQAADADRCGDEDHQGQKARGEAA